MRYFILARYILREHIGPFFFAFFTITLLFLLNLLFRELGRILSRGLPWQVVLEFFILNMAWMVALSVPMAVLTATLMAFGRMAADHEVAAMEANGVSIYAILAPVVVASALLALGLVWFNNNVLPDFNHRTRLLYSDIARKRPTINLEPGVWYDDIPNYGLLVQELKDSATVTQARNLLINDYTSPTLSRTISARRGVIATDAARSALVLSLYDGEMQEIDLQKPEEFRRIEFPKHVITIVIDDLFLSRSEESQSRGDREKSAQQMRAEVDQQQQEMAQIRGRINTALAVNMPSRLVSLMAVPRDSALHSTVPVLQPRLHPKEAARAKIKPRTSATRPPAPDFPAPLPGQSMPTPLAQKLQLHRQLLHQVERETSQLKNLERKSKSLTVEIEKKYSIPVACLVFVLIGAPLGIMSRRGGLATGGAISLVFFLLYWTSLVGGEDLADRQIISPFLAMWAANFIVGAAGLYFVWRAAHHQTGLSLADLWQKIGNRFKFAPSHAREKTASLIHRSHSALLRLLDFYVTRKFLFTLAFALIAFVTIFIVVDVIERLSEYLDREVPGMVIASYFFYYIPYILVLMFPLAMLLAALFSVGQMSRYNEITAMKAAGLSLYRVLAPLLIIGFIFSLGMLAFAEYAVPVANQRRAEIKNEYMDRLPRNLPAPQSNLYLQESSGRDPAEDWFRPASAAKGHTRRAFIGYYNTAQKTADRISVQEYDGVFIAGRIDASALRWQNDHWRAIKGYQRTFQEGKETAAPFDTLALTNLFFTPEVLYKVQKEPEEMSYRELKKFIQEVANNGSDPQRWLVDLYLKISFPFASFIMVLFGAPLAVGRARSRGAVGIALTLVIAFLYFGTVKTGQTLGQSGALPPLFGAWMGNILFLIGGIIVLWRART